MRLGKFKYSAPDVSSATKKIDVDVDVNTKNIDYDVNTKQTTSFSSPTSNTAKFDSSDVASAKNMDLSSATKRADFVDGIKKLESDTYTARFGETIKKSSFYQKNQGKLLAMGITVAGAAAWFGVLLAQGHSPAEAWAIMTETVSNWTKGVGGAVLQGLWTTFVFFVHNSVGYKYFDEVEGTESALKSLFVFLVMYKILGLFGINLITLPFKLIGLGGKKK